MPHFEDFQKVKIMLGDAQSADEDNRDQVREAHHFLDKRDGQWEPDVTQSMTGRPRYTFDMCNPVVDQIAGEMEQADFDIKIRPAGGDATKDLAKTFDGLIRNIENLSNATDVFNAAGRSMVTGGMDGWRIITDWAQSTSMDQDLFIVKIANFVDRVWFDPSSEKQDRSDANYCFVLQSLSMDEYKEQFPEGSKQSVSQGVQDNVYFNKAESIIVGEFLYREPTDIKLVMMSNDAVYEAEQLEPVLDELLAAGITEVRRRTRKGHKVFSRMFDGQDWLKAKEPMVFEWLPVIPTYANFKISENKVIYRGVVEKLIDPQRVYNYAKSREIEEGALAPRAKFWGTREQFVNDTDTLQTMNTNANPIQTYTHVDNQPPPFWTGGAQINPGLQVTAQDAAQSLQVAAGLFSANMGANPGLQSGTAIELQQNKGDTGTIKYFKSQEIAICHTARILISAIPKTYDTKRQIRILNEDGSFEMTTLNDNVLDEETGNMVMLNDLSKGLYDVTCDVGPAFKNRQQETARALVELAEIVPGIAQMGADVLLGSINAPGVDIIQERVRAQMVQSGGIPVDQLSDEEKQQLQAAQQAAAQQPQEPTPEEKIGEAELKKAQADEANTQSIIEDRNKQFELEVEKTKINAEDTDQKMNLEAQKMQIESQKMQLESQKLQLDSRKLDMQQNANQTKASQQEDVNEMKLNEQQFSQQQAQIDMLMKELKNNADVLKTLREAMGVDSIVGPHNTEAYIQQAEMVTDTQTQLSPNLETTGIAIDTDRDTETDRENLSDNQN